MNAVQLEVTSRPRRDGRAVVQVQARGELDSYNAAQLQRVLTTAIAQNPAAIDLDLADVTFFDCAALRVLEHADAITAGRLRLKNPSQPVRLVLTLLGWQQRFRTLG